MMEINILYKLSDLDQILEKCEDNIGNRIAELKLKEANDYLNFMLYSIGKSIVSTREVIILCNSGYPDGALSLARNVYEQLIISLYFKKSNEESTLMDLLHRYNEDYSYQRARGLKYEAQYLKKDKDLTSKFQTIIDEIKTRNNIKRIKDYWWANEKGTTFSELCNIVIEYNKDMESMLRLMHFIYKRACLSLHASSMGNSVRLGSNCGGIDLGPWARGQENALFLSTASLVYIVSITYELLGIDETDVNKSLIALMMHYHCMIRNRSRKKENDPVIMNKEKENRINPDSNEV